VTDTRRPEELAADDLLRAHKNWMPAPYGRYAAAEGSGAVATPLLAGFALTTVTIVLTGASNFRWPDLVLALLTASVVSFVMCVQAAQWARTFRVDPREAAAWWPGLTDLDRDEPPWV
jgi:hypothetical protein